jgi:hypothetical protein
MADPIERLAQAGLVNLQVLTPEDAAVLSQLTEQEVRVLIEVATRLYPDAKSILKLGVLLGDRPRLCVPL